MDILIACMVFFAPLLDLCLILLIIDLICKILNLLFNGKRAKARFKKGLLKRLNAFNSASECYSVNRSLILDLFSPKSVKSFKAILETLDDYGYRSLSGGLKIIDEFYKSSEALDKAADDLVSYIFSGSRLRRYSNIIQFYLPFLPSFVREMIKQDVLELADGKEDELGDP